MTAGGKGCRETIQSLGQVRNQSQGPMCVSEQRRARRGLVGAQAENASRISLRWALSWYLEFGLDLVDKKESPKVSQQQRDPQRCLLGNKLAAGQGRALGAARRKEGQVQV